MTKTEDENVKPFSSSVFREYSAGFFDRLKHRLMTALFFITANIFQLYPEYTAAIGTKYY